MSIKFLVLGGGGVFWVLGGGKCRFYFYGRGEFSDVCPTCQLPKKQKKKKSSTNVGRIQRAHHCKVRAENSTIATSTCSDLTTRPLSDGAVLGGLKGEDFDKNLDGRAIGCEGVNLVLIPWPISWRI